MNSVGKHQLAEVYIAAECMGGGSGGEWIIRPPGSKCCIRPIKVKGCFIIWNVISDPSLYIITGFC